MNGIESPEPNIELLNAGNTNRTSPRSIGRPNELELALRPRDLMQHHSVAVKIQAQLTNHFCLIA